MRIRARSEVRLQQRIDWLLKQIAGHGEITRTDHDGFDDSRHGEFCGYVHGGTILKLLDQVAYACASRYASRYVVTASVDNVNFRERIHVGELVTFMASVNHSGRSSMEVGIKVIAEDIRSQAQRHVNSCYFTMVAVGDDGQPVEVPPLQPQTETEKRRFDGAALRKKIRLQYVKRSNATQ